MVARSKEAPRKEIAPRPEGEYAGRGDYHVELDPHWSYAPLYRRKVELVDRFVSKLERKARILDVGAGEGHMVDRYREQGYEICGVDTHYNSDLVHNADAASLPFPDASFDAVLCLDVLEHIGLLEQRAALGEMHRVLSEVGKILLSLPNLAHLHSRIRFLLFGRLTRTSAVERHPGDRPIGEYMELLSQSGFTLVSRQGIFPTVPFLFRIVNRRAARMGWMVGYLDRLLPWPGLCFLNIVEARRTDSAKSRRSNLSK